MSIGLLSISDSVNQLHFAYCAAMGGDYRMTPAVERQWWNAHKAGATPEDVKLSIESRLKVKRAGGLHRGLEIHMLVGDEDRIAVMINEADIAKNNMRIKVVDKGKAEVMRATHRPAEPPETAAKQVCDVKLMQDLKRAAS